MQQSYNFAGLLSSQQAQIKKYAGNRAKDINIVVTEYGINSSTSPEGQPNYHRSIDAALFMANTLKIIVDAHIPLAEKHFLISYEFSNPSGPQTFINSSSFANNALIAGPGSNPVLEPSAYVLQAYSKLLYSNLVSSNINNNPSVVFSGGSYPSLSVVPTTNKNGGESILIMNLSPSQNIQAQILPSVSSYTKVNSWTMGSTNSLSYNSPNNPNQVGFVTKTSPIINGNIVATFPASSITVLQLNN
jgi:hypothetical protein